MVAWFKKEKSQEDYRLETFKKARSLEDPRILSFLNTLLESSSRCDIGWENKTEETVFILFKGQKFVIQRYGGYKMLLNNKIFIKEISCFPNDKTMASGYEISDAYPEIRKLYHKIKESLQYYTTDEVLNKIQLLV